MIFIRCFALLIQVLFNSLVIRQFNNLIKNLISLKYSDMTWIFETSCMDIETYSMCYFVGGPHSVNIQNLAS